MSTLLLRLVGPMQSWGEQSRFVERDTGLEPTKSGVLGLVCAAMGVPRTDDTTLARLGALWMGVRVDREGVVCRDYQTAGGGQWPGRKQYGVIKADGSTPDTVVSTRYYLSDAAFLVALGGARDWLERIQAALKNPVWPLCLGRKAFPPSEPVWLPEGVLEIGPIEALSSFRLISEPRRGAREDETGLRLRVVLECDRNEGQPRMDQPISFAPRRRRFTVRYVRTQWIDGSQLTELSDRSTHREVTDCVSVTASPGSVSQ
jgi:CRISPR system Cascade subunit CasD